MKIYYVSSSGSDSNMLLDFGVKRTMMSYLYKLSKKYIDNLKENGVEIMIDSGAFSAWKRGIEIDIDSYIEYIKSNSIDKYICLDVVGNSKKTYENQKYMELKGLYPIPVFHFGEDIKYLDTYVNEGYTYICLGGTVGQSRQARSDFFDICFRKYPEIKFHGLGMTDYKIMLKYNWESVDSSTWLIGRKFRELQTFNGREMLPRDMSSKERLHKNILFFQKVENMGNLK